MTPRPAAPESETPEVEEYERRLDRWYPSGFDRETNEWLSWPELARSLERRLSLAQTEIKGHMRNIDDLKAAVVASAELGAHEHTRLLEALSRNLEAHARVAELEKALVSLLAFPFEIEKLERGSEEGAAAMAEHGEVLEAARNLVGAVGSLKDRA